MKKKVNSSSNPDANNGEVLKKKERHIVSWSQEEDDILREQIRLHGSENWAIIASKFKDKTTRQCRRRWFTYLNSDFKKGGWLPEEDMLLCEAQRIYGNRWTEIAKVVSGRTDNAVKNRFTTLCKKRAKAKSSTSYVNLNNKRVIFCNGLNSDEGSENALKKIRSCIPNLKENRDASEHLLSHPYSAVGRNFQSCEIKIPSQKHEGGVKEESTVKSMENMFLKKGDPTMVALLQQAELLSSLSIKVNTVCTDQSLESAWTVLQDFLKQNKEREGLLKIKNGDDDFQQEKVKESEEELEDTRSCDEGSRSSWRELDVHESSPTSSEYSTGSTLVSNVPCDRKEESEEAALHALQAKRLDLSEENGICHVGSRDEVKNMPTREEIKANNGDECDYANTNFSSPAQVIPLFRALAATIPSPKFSESEKHFLMKTLGLESSSPAPTTNPSQPPPCKRSLLHCL